jgi:hypothetical protein
MIRQQNIQTKLICAVSLVLAIAAGSSAYSWVATGNIRSDVAQEIGDSTALLDQAQQITAGIANMRSAMRGVSLFAMMQNMAQLAKARAAFEETASQMRQATQAMEVVTSNATDKAAVAAIGSALNQWVGNFAEFADLSAAGHAEEASNITLKKTPL